MMWHTTEMSLKYRGIHQRLNEPRPLWSVETTSLASTCSANKERDGGSSVFSYSSSARGGTRRMFQAANYGNTIADAAAAVVEVQMKERFGSEKREQREWIVDFRTSRWPWSKNNSYCHGWMMENSEGLKNTCRHYYAEGCCLLCWEKKKKRCLCFWKWEILMPHPKHALRCLLRRMYSSTSKQSQTSRTGWKHPN